MTPLEQSLIALGRELEWPPTPELALRLEPARPSRGRALALAFALLLLALAVALAVPPARSSILRFLHLRGATVELVDTLPRAEERALADTLGRPVARDAAERDVGFRLLLPAGTARPTIYELQGTLSVLLATPEPVLLTELKSYGSDDNAFFKKVAGMATHVEWVTVGGENGIWLGGPQHVFFGPGAPPRLAGNTLLWQHGGVTLRLEGKRLAKEAALRLAATIR
jgi:hypothetical protein